MWRRLQTILNNDVIHLTFFGGSVTEGYPYAEVIPQPYPELTAQKWMQAFPGKTSIVHNHAGCGEKSSRALLMENILADQYAGHIIFLEYALTDDMSKESVMIYESLVRRLIARKDKPAVVTLLMPSQKNLQIKTFMKEISEHYDIPCLDFSQLLREREKDHTIVPESFWFDATHPSKEGHDWIADEITAWMERSMRSTLREKTPYRLPSKRYFASPYEKIKTIVPDKELVYPYTLEVYGSVIWISYFQHEEPFMGTVRVFVDQSFVCNLHGKSFYCWYYPVQVKIFEGKEAARHTITFQMAPGDEKKKFMLECIGYGKFQ